MFSARPNVLRDVQETSGASDPVGVADRDRASDRHAADDGTDATYRVKTVFPRVLPSHIARNASSARSIGRTVPISGSIPARAIKFIMLFMSSSVPMMEPVMVSWLLIIGRRFSGTSNPVVPPVVTSVPPRASDDRLCAQVAEPMLSMTADTFRGRDALA